MRTGSTFVAERAAGALLFPAAPALLGAVLVLAREVGYGPCLTTDGAEYIAAARNLAAGEGFFVGVIGPITHWPPLYPLLLAAAGALLRLDPLDAVGPLNAAVFGLTVFVFGRYLRRRLDSCFAAAWASAALALSVPLADAASWSMSEPPFILVTTLALIEIDKFLTAGKRRSLAAAAAWSALAALTRYIGAVVVVFAGLALLLRQGAPPQRRTREAAVFLSAACLPAALWILRNYLFFDTFTGFTSYSDGLLFNSQQPQPLLRILRQAFVYLLEWTHLDLAWAAAAALGAIAAAAFASRRRAPAARSALWIWGGFALTYFVLLVTAVSAGFAPSLNDSGRRFLLPLWIPLLVFAAFALDWFLGRGRERKCGGGGGGAADCRRHGGALPVAGGAGRGQCPLHKPNQCGRPSRSILLQGAALCRFRDAALHRGAPRRRLPQRLPERCCVQQLTLSAVPVQSGQSLIPTLAERTSRPDARPDKTRRRAEAGGGEACRRSARRLGGLSRKPVPRSIRLWRSLAEHAPQSGAGGANSRRRHVQGQHGRRAPPESVSGRASRGGRGGSAAGHGSRGGGGFDVSWRGGELIYIKQECSEQDARTRFFLHVWPQDEAVLAADRKPHGMDNMDFWFRKYGVVIDGACVALHPLPDYAVARIRTGQHAPERGALWQTELSAAPPARQGLEFRD